MAHWQSEWHAFEKMPIVALEWMNWDDDDDGKTHRVWWSYVVYPWDDTAHLMHSPANAAELDAAIAELDAGLGVECELMRDFTAASEPAFSKIWDNPQDAIYDVANHPSNAKCNHSHEPNAETIAAMKEARRGEGLVTVDGIDGLMAYLHADEEEA